MARLIGAEMKIPFLSSLKTTKNNNLNINPYTYECIDYDNMYALGALAGDKLVRFLQGGAIACAANLFKKHRQAISSKRLPLGMKKRTRINV